MMSGIGSFNKVEVKQLKLNINGEWHDTTSGKYLDIYNSSTGEKMAKAPMATVEELNQAVQAAREAFAGWADTPVMRRVQVLYKFRELIEAHFEELVLTLCKENGKVWGEAEGDVLKAKEIVELACGTPSLMMGESLMNTSTGFDTVLYREPLGVFVGIAPFNFPAMIPMGWMMPLCIATGNTMVLKASNATPMTSMRMTELLYESGLPKGVFNLVTCENEVAETLITHPDVKGVSFVGSTKVGRHVYSTAAAHGKRVQALCQAKNHALVLEDAALERTARGIISASYGCAGERCMALPAVVVQESIADELTSLIVQFAGELKLGPSYEKTTDLGPLVTKEHLHLVKSRIDNGMKEGAELVLDGRQTRVDGYEQGYYLGPNVFDNVKPGMSVGDEEIFGPVLSIKRVKDFEEGIHIMNSNPYANGSIIFTQNGYYSREFARRSHAGMVGVNVGIPVPVGIFPFSGHKLSFFGDLHVLGKDGVKFFTESKAVTTRWFDEEEMKRTSIDTWDGGLGTK
jgi:malonate-semialdehyde dehydrogenase (acetylating)/methylmalonate-semialdehyde dehydrogenase